VVVTRGDETPRLILDGGTGLMRVTTLLKGEPFRGTLLLGHLHWDHTHGIPFFGAGNRPDAEVTVLIPAQEDAEKVLERVMSPPHFPIRPRELTGEWQFGSIEPGDRVIEGFSVRAIEIPHKGGRMFAYRVSDGTATVAYVSDHAPNADGPGENGLGTFHDAIMEAAAGVDLLIHDAQYTAEEFVPPRSNFGHSAIEYAIELGMRAGATRLLLFHHDPSRTDDALDALVAHHRARLNGTMRLDAAVEGSVIDLPG
jgi:phosphoribosyl 1,2-cyclic phosphodiesterase